MTVPFRIDHAKIGDWCAEYDGPPFHACLCDPPYHLYNPTTKRPAGEWDGTRKDPFQRSKGGGFMGKDWDGGDVAFRPETWAAIGEHLLPGAFLMAFASSRGWHRLATAIEDAGFRIHPTIFCWITGQGFPKATRIPDERFIGHRYGGQILKPATEPIILARKDLTDCNIGAMLAEETNLLLEAFLCQFINVQDAESLLSEAGEWQNEASGTTAHLLVSLIASAVNLLPDDAQTAISPWSVEASTILSIASSWSNILDVNSGRMSTSTISTPTEAITALKILKSYLMQNTPEAIIRAVFPQSGSWSNALGVGESFNDASQKHPNIRKRIAPVNVSSPADSSIRSSNANNADANLSLWAPLQPTSAVTVLLSAMRQVGENREGLKLLAKSAEEFIGNLSGIQRQSSGTVARRVGDNLPIIVAQKPYRGKPVDSITTTGAGALWVDGGRVAGDVNAGWNKTKGTGKKFIGNTYNNGQEYDEQQDHFDPHPAGRWPANLALDSVAAEALGRQSGSFTATAKIVKATTKGNGRNGTRTTTASIYGSGSESGDNPARFFFQAQWSQIDDAEPFMYCAKASRRERDAGLDEFEAKPIRDAGNEWGKMTMWNGDNGDDEWRKKNPNHPARNPHPCIKPVALARWLATLLLPPAEYAPRRIIVPFAGSGSEMIGAGLAGWEDVTGIEQDADNCEIARARLTYWLDPLQAMKGD